MRFAINGFGRIGKCILRAYIENKTSYKDCDLVALNVGNTSMDSLLYVIKYDSIHGTMNGVIQIDDSTIAVSGKEIKIIFERDIKKINWSSLNIDCVLESTGSFNKKNLSALHIDSGAKSVIVSAPCEDADATIVLGVNDNELKLGNHKIISIGSCTTNCLAPIAKILDEGIGIESGFMTTIHSYTNDQNIVDAKHKDKRRGRTAALSMIPTKTGAAKSIGLVLPNLMGKLDGSAIRIPTPNVSLIDFKFKGKRSTSVNEINYMIKEAADSNMKGVLSQCTEELVSVDFNHNPSSAVFDATQTKVVNGDFCRVVAWYDNEWGFSNRMLDVMNIWK